MLQRATFGLGVWVAALGVSSMAVSSAALGAEPARLGDGPTTSETRPGDTSRDRVSSPYWQSGSSDDLPATDIRLVPGAKAAAVQARWTHLQLSTDLNIATRMRVIQLESTPEYRQAVSEESAAYEAMQSARGNALSGLRNNDAYLAAESLRDNLTLQIRDLHDAPKPDYDRIAAVAKVKLSYIADNRKLETDALARDSAYQDARRKYVAAAQRVIELRQANALTIATDDDLLTLRRQVAEARIAKLTSAAYLDSAVRARNIAVRYAVYSRDSERYRPASGSWYPLGGYYPAPIRYVRY